MFSSSAEIISVEHTDDFRVAVVAGMDEQKKIRSHCLLDSVITVYYCFPSIVPIVKLNDTTPDDYISSPRVQRIFENNRLFHRRYERIR